MDNVLWKPPPDVLTKSRIGAYLSWLRTEQSAHFTDYEQVWSWSVDDLAGFWTSVWRYFSIQSYDPPRSALGRVAMPGTEWFPGSTLNYAEHVLRAPGLTAETPVVISHSQARHREGTTDTLTVGELRDQVARLRAGLTLLGVGLSIPSNCGVLPMQPASR